MGVTTIRIGASMAKSLQEVIDWLRTNVGPAPDIPHFADARYTYYYGENWEARWSQFGAGWFLDVTFNDPKDATFFTLRWK